MNLLQKIEFEKYQLSNGLDVILHEDHTIPLVAVNIWYHVGSKNEKPGRTGFAHLFEHLMFQGSEHHNYDYFEPLEKIGGSVNGSTSQDRTNYWENTPNNYLELALWLESDRMGFLLPAITQERLDNQRDVVKNERRQGIENQPYGKSYEILLSMLYPSDHPYSWPVIGRMDDLSAASLEDVSQFFRNFYTPNNASLCIAGDFERSMAKEMVEKYFAPIPSGPPVDKMVLWIPEINGIKRIIAEDNVKLARVYYSWHTPKEYTPGDAELEILDNILVSGKSSRLYKSLVYEKQIAHDVEAYQHPCELGSTFTIHIDVKEDHSPEEIEDALNFELEKIFRDGITQDELDQAKTAWEVNLVRSLEQIGGFGGRADKLNKYNVMLGDPGKLSWDIKRFEEIKVDQVQQHAKKYLDLNKRVVLHIVPQGEFKAIYFDLDRSIMPKPSKEVSFKPPKIQKDKLSNGLEIFLVEDHKLPLVQVDLAIKSGQASDLPNELTAASLTVELLDEGTKSRNAIQIAEEAKRLGADLDTFISFDGSYINLNILKRNLEPGLSLMSDIILNPTFPEEELERQRKIYLGNIQQESKQPVTVAYITFMSILYGKNHPYGCQPYTGSGTEASIKAIKREYLLNYYKSNYVPNNAAIAIAGDITMDEAKEKLEKFFGSWRPAEIRRPDIPDPTPIKSSKVYIIDRPGSAQSVIVVGNPGIRRNSQDYIASSVMNNAFGGQFTSRLNMNLREDKGYTYGASSFFHKTKGVGSFMCVAQVQTQVTKEAVAEIIKEIKDIVGPRPLTDDELINSKNNLIKGFPQEFQSYSRIASRLTDMIIYDIPESEWYEYISNVNSVDVPTATKAARDHLYPDNLLITIVGDGEKVKPGIQELGFKEIYLMDGEGNTI